MAREIEFRGLDLSGIWRYGYFTVDSNNRYVISTKEENWEVLPESVGQFTGLKDKNGKEIFEGDIVNMHYDGGDYDPSGYAACKVFFEEFQWKIRSEDGEWGDNLAEFNSEELEVIGNIYQNPKLLK